MKKALKLTLVVVCTMISTSLFAQKFGRINSQEIVTSMNEFKEAQTQIQAYAKDLDAQLETIGVEFNTKLQEFQQSADTLGDAMRQLKEKELNDLQTRYQEFQQMASSDMQKKQMESAAHTAEVCRCHQRGSAGRRLYRCLRHGDRIARIHRRGCHDGHQRRGQGQARHTVTIRIPEAAASGPEAYRPDRGGAYAGHFT